MPIPVQCPGCQHAFMVGDEFAGKKGKCPKCKQVLRVDEPVYKAAGHSSSAPPPPPPRRSGSSRSVPVPPPLPDSVASTPSNGEPPAMFVANGNKPGGKTDAARYAKRKKSSGLPLPIMIAGGIGALAAVGVTIGVIWSMNNNSGDKEVAKNGDKHVAGKDDKHKKPGKEKETPKATKTDIPTPPAPPPRDNSPAGLRKRVLALEIKTPMGDVKAAAFVADERGYAVTVFHAIANASKVEAITADGKRIPVSGILMPDPFHDLALVKLVLPDDLKIDKLDVVAKELPVGEKIQGIDLANAAAPLLPGKLMSRDAFDKLTVVLQTRLNLLSEEWVKDTNIFKHDVNLSIDSSGTPILTAEGQVQAVHVTADKGVGFAVSGQYVKDLIARASTDAKPFANAEAVAAVEPPKTTDPPVTPMPEMPVKPEETEPPKTAELPKRPMRKPVVDDDYEDLLRKIDDAADECWRRRWVAEDTTDYGVFQEFSSQIMELGKELESPAMTEENSKRLNKFAEEMFDQLKGELWPDRKGWEATNKLALDALEANPNQGFFGLATMLMTMDHTIDVGGKKFALMAGEVVGTGKQIVILVPEGTRKPRGGEQIVVVGKHEASLTVMLNANKVSSVKLYFVIPAKK